MPKKAKPPFLDTIETSAGIDFSQNLNSIKASEPSEEKKLSIALNNIGYYKKLTDNIAKTLVFCATADDFIFGERASKLLDCGTELQLDDNGRVVFANFCRLRICPMCQRRRALRIASDFKKIMDKLDCAWLHLVFTVPNCSASELSGVLDDMQIASSRFFRVDFVKKAFKGVARCTEVTYNVERNNYHPHFHCLVAVNKSYFTSRYYLRVEDIRKLWTALVNAQMFGKCIKKAVDVKGFDVDGYKEVRINVKNRSDKWVMGLLEGFDPDVDGLYQCSITKANEGSIPEVAKYCVKPLQMDLEGFDLYEPLQVIFNALHNRRLIQLYGTVADASRALGVDFDTDNFEDVSDKSDTNIDIAKIRRYNWDRKGNRYLPSVKDCSSHHGERS